MSSSSRAHRDVVQRNDGHSSSRARYPEGRDDALSRRYAYSRTPSPPRRPSSRPENRGLRRPRRDDDHCDRMRSCGRDDRDNERRVRDDRELRPEPTNGRHRSRGDTRHRDRSRSRERHRDDRRDREHRPRRREDEDHRRRDRRRSRSRSPESPSSASDTDSSSPDASRRKMKKKHRRRSRDDGQDTRKRRERKRDVADRKMSTTSSTIAWGKYGIITEAEAYKKDSARSPAVSQSQADGQEFKAWLIEQRKLNPDMLSRDRSRRELLAFIEDFNTATLVHEKYYDLEKWHHHMSMVRAGYTLPLDEPAYDAMADLKAHNSSVKARKRRPSLTQEEVEELRRVERERVEIGRMRLLGINVPREMGVRREHVNLESMKYD